MVMCIVPDPSCELYPGSNSGGKPKYGRTKMSFLNTGRECISIDLSIRERCWSFELGRDRAAPIISGMSTAPVVAMSLAISRLLI